MPRIGLLGLEPFLVSQIERLDRNLEIMLLDAIDDDAREDLDLSVVMVNSEHAGALRLIAAHPTPPVVVVEDGAVAHLDDRIGPDGPIRLGRPISSPDLLEALDRSRGLSRFRRSLRGMTIQQDDAAGADRWAAVARTLASLGALYWAADNLVEVGILAVLVLTLFAVGRSLWWRLTPLLIGIDAVVVLSLLYGTSVTMGGPEFPLTVLAAAVTLEAGFVLGLWRSLVGTAVAVGLMGASWIGLLGRSMADVLATSPSALLLLTTVAAGAMARRLWMDQTQSRSSELRRFRSALYDLSRSQAVVAVSFDIGTVAEDALARLIADVHPRSAMVLVADGPGALQVAASHNLASPPPVRLTWQTGMNEAQRALGSGPATRHDGEDGPATPTAPRRFSRPEPRVTGDLPEWQPSRARTGDDGEDDDVDDVAATDAPSRDRDVPDAADPDESNVDRSSADDSPHAELDDSSRAGSLHDATTRDDADVPGPDTATPSPEERWGLPEHGDEPEPDPEPEHDPADTFHQPVSAPPPATDALRTPEPPSGDGLTAKLLKRMEDARRQEAATDIDEHIGSRFDGQATTAPEPGSQAPLTAADVEKRLTGSREAGADEQRILRDLLDRTVIESNYTARLTSVLGQLAPSLPPGDVLVTGAELDGELMGALVVVGATDGRVVSRHAEETALALDSVRLFNRLRAFTRDQERARIGRSLHDGVMQTLAHVAFELDRVSNDSWDESQVETLGRLRDHVLGTVDEMRAVVNDLRTVRLDRGLPAALEAMALTLSPAGGPVIEVSTGSVGSLPGDVEEQFLRIAEEGLMNAVRHSGARNVRVNLARSNGSLVLQVSDDGFGFTKSKVGDSDGGVGLTSMYQRAKSVGAGLDIDTGANGTIITVHQSLVTADGSPGASEPETEPTPQRSPGRRRRRSR